MDNEKINEVLNKPVEEVTKDVAEAVDQKRDEAEKTVDAAKEAAEAKAAEVKAAVEEKKAEAGNLLEGLKKDILGDDGKFDDTDIQRIAANAAKNIEDAINEAKAAFGSKDDKKE